MVDDQERWSRSLAKQHSGKSMSSKEQSHSPPEINRYKHDMEQAQAMRGGRRAVPSPIDTTTTLDDIQLGLRGLDEADALNQQGHYKKALDLYGKSIELLLKCLKTKQKKEFDEEVVSARVTVALSDAEKIKERLKQQKKKSSQDASQPTCESPKSAWENLSSALASALQRAPEIEKQHQPTTRSTKKPTPTNKVTVPRKSPPSSATHQNHAAPVSRPASVATKQPSNRTVVPRKSPRSDAPRRRTRLDYDNDPYVQAVKADLYVDHSELESTTWSDVAGLETAKRSLQESAILPLIRPDLYTGLRRPQNILLYGPPGTGKTMLVRAVAHESQCLLFSCTASALTSKWFGEGEKLVRTLFRVAHDVAPSLIFLDEVDALLSSRKEDEHEASRRFKTEFMIQMDGLRGNETPDGNVLVVACTNLPWNIDDAVMRRFPRRIFVPLPDPEARRGLLDSLLKKAGPHSLRSRDIGNLVQKTEGYSCSDIKAIASEASFGPLRSLGGIDAIRDVRSSDVRKISARDFDEAINQSAKSVSPALLSKYKQWEKEVS